MFVFCFYVSLSFCLIWKIASSCLGRMKIVLQFEREVYEFNLQIRVLLGWAGTRLAETWRDVAGGSCCGGASWPGHWRHSTGQGGEDTENLQMSLIVDVVTFEGLMPSVGVTLAGLGSKSNENVWNRAEGPRGVTITIYV